MAFILFGSADGTDTMFFITDGIFEMPSESLALADSLSAKVLDTLLSEAGKVSSGEMVGDSSPSPIPEV